MSRTKQPRTQKLNLNEKYETYLASNGEPQDANSNPLNLFDGSNAEDRAWIRIAKIYMTQTASRLRFARSVGQARADYHDAENASSRQSDQPDHGTRHA